MITKTEAELIAQMLDAAKAGDMDTAARLKVEINALASRSTYTENVRLNAWGDHPGRVPNPESIDDPEFAERARRILAAIAHAEATQTVTAHVDAAAELDRLHCPTHAAALRILARKLMH